MSRNQKRDSLPDSLKYGLFAKKVRREYDSSSEIEMPMKTPKFPTDSLSAAHRANIRDESSRPKEFGSLAESKNLASRPKTALEMFAESNRKYSRLLDENKENPSERSMNGAHDIGLHPIKEVGNMSHATGHSNGPVKSRDISSQASKLDMERPSQQSRGAVRSSRLFPGPDRSNSSRQVSRASRNIKIDSRSIDQRRRPTNQAGAFSGLGSALNGSQKQRAESPGMLSVDTASIVRIVQPANSVRSSSASSSFSDFMPGRFSKLTSAKVDIPWKGSTKTVGSSIGESDCNRASHAARMGDDGSERDPETGPTFAKQSIPIFCATESKNHRVVGLRGALGPARNFLANDSVKTNRTRPESTHPVGSLTDWKRPKRDITPILKGRSAIGGHHENSML